MITKNNPAKAYSDRRHIDKKKEYKEKSINSFQVNNFNKKIKKISQIISTIIVIILALLGPLILNASKWVLDTWGNLSMDEIIFHLNAPIEGTNTDLFTDFLNVCFSEAVVVAIAVGITLIGIWKHPKIRNVVMASVVLVAMVSCWSGINLLWNRLNIGDYIQSQRNGSTFIEDNYKNPNDVNITFPNQKRNLVYIYMESMESTYADKKSGGAFNENYIKELSDLAESNINFSSTDKTGGIFPSTGTTWTMGALFGQTSGLPLKAEAQFRTNTVDKDVKFVPNVTVLGEVLEQAGYKQAIMFGSDGAFAGRQNYFEQHGNYEVWDYYYALEEKEIPENYRVWWGYEDKYLFELAKKKVLELADGSDPFNLSILTVDTHFEDGYVCSLCEDEFGDNQYANVLACSSKQIYEFINWMKHQDFYTNTTIVLVGDHLTMDSDFCESIDEDYDRSVFNAFINSAISTNYSKNRIGTTIDMFPTTLASLGIEIEGERLGLGTNLFSGEKTLAEKVGLRSLNNSLSQKSDFFSEFAGDQLRIEDWYSYSQQKLQLRAQGIDYKILSISSYYADYLMSNLVHENILDYYEMIHIQIGAAAYQNEFLINSQDMVEESDQFYEVLFKASNKSICSPQFITNLKIMQYLEEKNDE